MKLFFTYLLFFSLYSNAQSNQKKILEKVTYMYSIKSESNDTLGGLSSLIQFDSIGNTTLDITYCKFPWDCVAPKEIFESKYEYKYNDQGLLIERNYYSKGADLPWSMSKYSYKINTARLVSEKTTELTHSFDQHKTFKTKTETEFYKYDAKGKLKEEKTIDLKNNYTYESTPKYFYDTKGNVIKVEYGSGEKKFSKSYSYDKNDNCISYQSEGRHNCGHNIDNWQKTFDDNGNLIKKTTCSALNKCSTIRYFYNDSNQRIKIQEKRKDGTFKNYESYTYNTYGELEYVLHYDYKGRVNSITKHIYKYY